MENEPLLIGYAQLMGFGQTPERVREIEPEIRRFMAEVDALWEVDVEGAPMAVGFNVEEMSW